MQLLTKFFSSNWSRNWRESITNLICTKSKKSHDFFRTFTFRKAGHTRVECYQLLFWHLTFVQFRERKWLKERNYQKTLQRFLNGSQPSATLDRNKANECLEHLRKCSAYLRYPEKYSKYFEWISALFRRAADFLANLWNNGSSLGILMKLQWNDFICPPGKGGTWVNFCWVCAAGLSEPANFYELTHFLDWMKNTLLFICSTNILVRLLTGIMKNCLTPKNPKICDPILVTLLKMRPNYSQSSRKNATPSNGTSPLDLLNSASRILQCWSYYVKFNSERHQQDTKRTQNRAGL